MNIPDPKTVYPVRFPDGSQHQGTVFLNQVLTHPNIAVGDFTYYSDSTLTPDTNLASKLAPYLFEGAPEQIRIGRYCQIAEGVQIITASANHDMSGLTTFPFPIFDPEQIAGYRATLPAGADIEIGNDVWIGREAVLMPNARIGDGAIIAARSVVVDEVPDFTIYGGNPAKLIRPRFGTRTIQRLKQLGWWDWPVEKVERAIPLLATSDLDALEALD